MAAVKDSRIEALVDCFLFFWQDGEGGGLTQHDTGDGSLVDVGRAADRLRVTSTYYRRGPIFLPCQRCRVSLRRLKSAVVTLYARVTNERRWFIAKRGQVHAHKPPPSICIKQLCSSGGDLSCLFCRSSYHLSLLSTDTVQSFLD